MSRERVVVTAVGDAGGSLALAAALAGAVSQEPSGALLVEIGGGAPRRPSLLASESARGIEGRIAQEVPEAAVAARGRICHLSVMGDGAGIGTAADAAASLPPGCPCFIHSPPSLFREVIDRAGLRPLGALLRADLPRDRPIAALAAGELIASGIRTRVVRRPLGPLAARRALAGASPGSSGARIATQLLRGLLGGERGQAMPLAIGAAAVLLITALALVAIAGALTGKARAQRAADLSAVSAARSMRDDLPRLLSPRILPGGVPNPLHLEKVAYLARARAAARLAAAGNGAGRLRVSFPDRLSFAPLRARAVVLARVEGEGRKVRVRASAVAIAIAPPAASATGAPAIASGGGYSGPLVYRQGEGMRPDVGAAFDRMSAGAAKAGLSLVVNSGFRSDAEQAALFAAHPDPRWVAPPGHSLHRCATELDLGPPDAYGWLAANARRYGFVQRYSWEAWHFGFDAGPAPCSAAGDSVVGAGTDGAAAGAGGLPSFVPARFRAPLLRAAARWNVSAALLAAQLMAESNFNPFAVSSAGAQGIAQFIPSTAAAYGLSDPFDPDAAIEAQAHLMSDLIRQFRSPSLALAAYNAGPAPVAACGCVPDIPETAAYVSRILSLLEGAGALLVPPFEVRLIE